MMGFKELTSYYDFTCRETERTAAKTKGEKETAAGRRRRANEKICKRESSEEVRGGGDKSAKCRHELGSLKRSRGEALALPAENTCHFWLRSGQAKRQRQRHKKYRRGKTIRHVRIDTGELWRGGLTEKRTLICSNGYLCVKYLYTLVLKYDIVLIST